MFSFRQALVLLAASGASAGCFFSRIEDGGFSTHREGGPATWEFRPDSCVNGTTKGFDGVLFISKQNPHQRIALVADTTVSPSDYFHDPDLTSTPRKVVVRDDAGHQQTFDAAHCAVFEGSLRREGFTVNKVRALSGALRLTCQAEDGSTFDGNIHFAKCSI